MQSTITISLVVETQERNLDHDLTIDTGKSTKLVAVQCWAVVYVEASASMNDKLELEPLLGVSNITNGEWLCSTLCTGTCDGCSNRHRRGQTWIQPIDVNTARQNILVAQIHILEMLGLKRVV